VFSPELQARYLLYQSKAKVDERLDAMLARAQSDHAVFKEREQ